MICLTAKKQHGKEGKDLPIPASAATTRLLGAELRAGGEGNRLRVSTTGTLRIAPTANRHGGGGGGLEVFLGHNCIDSGELVSILEVIVMFVASSVNDSWRRWRKRKELEREHVDNFAMLLSATLLVRVRFWDLRFCGKFISTGVVGIHSLGLNPAVLF